MLEINEMFAFVSQDDGGDEGITAFTEGNMWMPMVGADFARVDQLKPMARRLAKTSGRPIRIYRYKVRELIETIGPDDGP